MERWDDTRNNYINTYFQVINSRKVYATQPLPNVLKTILELNVSNAINKIRLQPQRVD